MKIVLDEKIIAEILSDKYELWEATVLWRKNLQVGREVYLVQENERFIDLKYFPNEGSIFAACYDADGGFVDLDRKFAEWLKKEYPEVFI